MLSSFGEGGLIPAELAVPPSGSSLTIGLKKESLVSHA